MTARLATPLVLLIVGEPLVLPAVFGCFTKSGSALPHIPQNLWLGGFGWLQ